MTRSGYIWIVAGLLWIQPAGAQSGGCEAWGEARRIGELARIIDEASGVEASGRHPGRFYHVDDSSATIHLTDSTGGSAQVVRVSGGRGVDVEDLALGPCPEGSCLIIADIGDNRGERNILELIVVAELDIYPPLVEPSNRVRFRYPDGPNNAEALAVHPNGDIFVVSRKLFPAANETHARLYRLPAAEWHPRRAEVRTLIRVVDLDFRPLADVLPGRLVTGMDISRDGLRMLLLTYEDAFEFRIDPEDPKLGISEDPSAGPDYTRIELVRLRQQEGIAYTADSKGFIYTTEAGRGGAPIMRVDCARR